MHLAKLKGMRSTHRNQLCFYIQQWTIQKEINKIPFPIGSKRKKIPRKKFSQGCGSPSRVKGPSMQSCTLQVPEPRLAEVDTVKRPIIRCQNLNTWEVYWHRGVARCMRWSMRDQLDKEGVHARGGAKVPVLWGYLPHWAVSDILLSLIVVLQR